MNGGRLLEGIARGSGNRARGGGVLVDEGGPMATAAVSM